MNEGGLPYLTLPLVGLVADNREGECVLLLAGDGCPVRVNQSVGLVGKLKLELGLCRLRQQGGRGELAAGATSRVPASPAKGCLFMQPRGICPALC